MISHPNVQCYVRVVAMCLLLSATCSLIAFASTAPAAGAFKGCAAAGKPAQNTNKLKNRSAQATQPTVAHVADLVALPTTGANVTTLQHEGIVVEGYLLQVRQEGKESCNCGLLTLHDFHLWMVDQPTEDRTTSAVIEMTPRWRDSNSGWRLSALQHLASTKAKIRVTGWRYLDPNHQDQVGITRGTRWEIHPITKFEVFNGGAWQEL